jgi:hypothetical protein
LTHPGANILIIRVNSPSMPGVQKSTQKRMGGNMRDPDQVQILCPYCGEQIDIQIDPAGGDDEYVEDCSVCCRPILLQVTQDENGEPSVMGTREAD